MAPGARFTGKPYDAAFGRATRVTDEGLDRPAGRLLVALVDKVGERATKEVGRRPAGDRLTAGADVGDDPRPVGHNNRIRGVLDEGAEPALALGKGTPLALPLFALQGGFALARPPHRESEDDGGEDGDRHHRQLDPGVEPRLGAKISHCLLAGCLGGARPLIDEVAQFRRDLQGLTARLFRLGVQQRAKVREVVVFDAGDEGAVLLVAELLDVIQPTDAPEHVVPEVLQDRLVARRVVLEEGGGSVGDGVADDCVARRDGQLLFDVGSGPLAVDGAEDPESGKKREGDKEPAQGQVARKEPRAIHAGRLAAIIFHR